MTPPGGGRGMPRGRMGGGGGGPRLTGANSVRVERDFGEGFGHRGLARGGAGGGGGEWGEPERGLNRGRRSPPMHRGGGPRGMRSRSRSRERLLPPQALQRDHRKEEDEEQRPRSTDAGQMEKKEEEMERRRSASVAKESEEKEDVKDGVVEGEDGEIKEEKRAKSAEKEEGEEDAAMPEMENLSDIGDSDDEILNKEVEGATAGVEERLESEGGKESENVEEEGETSRTPSRKSTEEKADNDLLEGISDEDLDVSDDEEGKKTKNKMTDALGVDWTQLMVKEEEEKPVVKGTLKKRWSLPSLLNRIGLSKKAMGDEYEAFVTKANESVEKEEEKFAPEHPCALVDRHRKAQREKRRTLFSEFGRQRALTAKSDIAVRRFLCKTTENRSGVLPQANTDPHWNEVAVKLFKEAVTSA